MSAKTYGSLHAYTSRSELNNPHQVVCPLNASRRIALSILRASLRVWDTWFIHQWQIAMYNDLDTELWVIVVIYANDPLNKLFTQIGRCFSTYDVYAIILSYQIIKCIRPWFFYCPLSRAWRDGHPVDRLEQCFKLWCKVSRSANEVQSSQVE